MKSEANQLTQAVITLLRLHNYHVWRQGNAPVYDKRKGVYRQNTVYKGVPDVIGLTPDGRFIGIEIKVGSDIMSVDQQMFKTDTEARNGIYIEVRTIEDVVSQLHLS